MDALAAGIDNAAQRTLTHFRRLRLSDLGQIQSLLLDVEGEPTGSYLVDVFDRVLAHELEAEEGIIKAAKELNAFSAASYPPPHVAGISRPAKPCSSNPDPKRATTRPSGLDRRIGHVWGYPFPSRRSRRRSGKADFVGRPEGQPGASSDDADLRPPAGWSAADTSDGGDLRPFGLKIGPTDRDARTAVIEIDGQPRWIKWNPKHVDTVSWDQLKRALDSDELRIVARLREAHALELQQRLLSGLGRVGLLAPMPATFPVDIDVLVVGVGGQPQRLEVGALNEGAVCFVGRDDRGKPALRLVMTEGAWDGVEERLAAIERAHVHQSARAAFDHVRSEAGAQTKYRPGTEPRRRWGKMVRDHM